MRQRKIEQVTQSPREEGFLGTGHTAAAVIDGSRYAETDPFILLMDDRLDLPGGSPVGGAHPHAGFETVTLVLEGDEREWETGSMELMTAGKGIVHTEEITSRTRMRILQLWLVLPPELRRAAPSWQQIPADSVPVFRTDKTEIRVYSGSSNGLHSPVKNHTPFTLADFHLSSGAEARQTIPFSYTAMVYVIRGSVQIAGVTLGAGQTGWLDRGESAEETEVVFHAKEDGARFILYAAQPHHVPVIHYGPFVGDTKEDIMQWYAEYRQGKIPHLNHLPASSKVRYGNE